MKNKFEALKAFQSWPREWQELCAEFWMEGDTSVPVVLQDGGVRFTSRAEPALPAIGDPFPYDRTRAVRKQRAAAKKIVPINRRDSAGFTLDELKYAKSGIELGVKPCLLAEDMAGRFGRTKKAFQNYISLIQRNGIDETTGRKKPLRSES